MVTNMREGERSTEVEVEEPTLRCSIRVHSLKLNNKSTSVRIAQYSNRAIPSTMRTMIMKNHFRTKEVEVGLSTAVREDHVLSVEMMSILAMFAPSSLLFSSVGRSLG